MTWDENLFAFRILNTGHSQQPEKEEGQRQPNLLMLFNEVLCSQIQRLIPTVDLKNMGVKAFTKLLSQECGGMDLKPWSKIIERAVINTINSLECDSYRSSGTSYS